MLKKVSVINILAILITIVAPLITFSDAQAANLSVAMVRLDRLAANPQTTGGTVCAKSAITATETTVKVTFPTGFGVNATAANWVIDVAATSSWPTSAVAWLGIGTASFVSGQDVTFPSGNIVSGTLYCFNFTGTNLTNPAAGSSYMGTITTQVAGPVASEVSNYNLSIISNDQIVITGTVPPNFTFALGGNADTFVSNLSTTVTSTAGRTATITTNAANGWMTWVKSANAGLASASTSATIATAGSIDGSVTQLTAANYGYVLAANITTDSVTSGTGTVSIASEYDALADTTAGGTLSASFQPVASSTGTTDTDVITLTERARVTAIQKAATDYTDTLTVVAAGLF